MTIQFHCEHCGRQVKTAREHAGKRGKCPHCHQSVYIPTPSEEIEPLPLAPLDTESEAEARRRQQEAIELARALQEEETTGGTESVAAADSAGTTQTHDAVEDLVIDYVLAMSAGKLDRAEELAVKIRGQMRLAAEFIQRLTMDELPPPRLAHIPRPLLNGFLRQLRESG